ncbi:MAG: tetratricopeptide repeat protein [Cyanobacteria bacterium P01_H01_bin.15]
MSEQLTSVYLGILLVILVFAAVFVLRQVLKTRRIESELTKLQRKLKDGTATAQEYYQLGGLLLDKKLFSQGIQVLKKAIKAAEKDPEPIAPDNVALVYNALGYAYFGQQQDDLAIRHYKEAIRFNPNYSVAYNNLGNVYERKKQIPAALDAYEMALQLDPKSTTAKRRATSLRKRIAA